MKSFLKVISCTWMLIMLTLGCNLIDNEVFNGMDKGKDKVGEKEEKPIYTQQDIDTYIKSTYSNCMTWEIVSDEPLYGVGEIYTFMRFSETGSEVFCMLPRFPKFNAKLFYKLTDEAYKNVKVVLKDKNKLFFEPSKIQYTLKEITPDEIRYDDNGCTMAFTKLTDPKLIEALDNATAISLDELKEKHKEYRFTLYDY